MVNGHLPADVTSTNMPTSCCVPGCRSNYYSPVAGVSPNVSVFGFPKEPERIQLWLDNINRLDFAPTRHSRVCVKHFEDRFVLRDSSVVRDDGSVLTVKRDRISLSKDAVPTLFEDLDDTPVELLHGNIRKISGKNKHMYTRTLSGKYKLTGERHRDQGGVSGQDEDTGDDYPPYMISPADLECVLSVHTEPEMVKDGKVEDLIPLKRKRGRPKKNDSIHPLLKQQPKVDLRKFRKIFEKRNLQRKKPGKRGRPRKCSSGVQFKPEMFKDDQARSKETPPVVKRGRGRPRKHPISEKTDGSPIKLEGTSSCCALACTNTSDTSVLHPLPDDPSLRQMWVEKIDRLDWIPDSDSAICDDHFDEDMWEKGGSHGERRLKQDAVPSLFLHGEAIKSWVTMDNSGNVLLGNHLRGDAGADYEHDNMSEDNDPDLYVKREALEPEIDMVEGSEDVLSQEPDSTEEGFETIYCDSTYNDQDVDLVPETGNPFDQESYHSNSFSEGSDSERNLKIQEDEVSCLSNNNTARIKAPGRENTTSNFFVISKANAFKMKHRKRRNSDQLTREFECKICHKRLSRKKNLEIHMEKLHPTKSDFPNTESNTDQDGKENQNILKTCLLAKKPPPPPLAPLLPSCLLASSPPMALPSISPMAAPTLMATPIVTSTMMTSPGAKDPSPAGGEMKKQFLLLLPQPPPPATLSPLPSEQALAPKVNIGDYFINLNQVPLDKRDSLKAKIKELVEAVSAKDLDPNRIIIAYDRT